MDEQLDNEPVNRLDLLLLIQAYNRHELSLDEFLRLSKAWAEAMQQKYAATTRTEAAMD
jgi:hypothetical protein